jgi:hypothetical protein
MTADAYAHIHSLVSVVKMVTLLEDAVLKSGDLLCRFLWAKGLNAKDIYKEMFNVYVGQCVSRKAVHN